MKKNAKVVIGKVEIFNPVLVRGGGVKVFLSTALSLSK